MTTIFSRFPSKRESGLLFVACIFPTHFWSILVFLRKVPALLLRLSLPEILSVFAYTQLYAFLESLFLTLTVGLLLVLFLKNSSQDRFVASGASLGFMISLWVIPIHFQKQIVHSIPNHLSLFMILIFLWVVSFFAVLIASFQLIQRSSVARSRLRGFIERLSTLSIAYLLIDSVSILPKESESDGSSGFPLMVVPTGSCKGSCIVISFIVIYLFPVLLMPFPWQL